MNPFVYLQRVGGDRFIGREEIIRTIEGAIFGSELTNLAIIGANKIGTSSLAYEKIFNRKFYEQVIPIWIPEVSYKNPSDFFALLVKKCADKLSSSAPTHGLAIEELAHKVFEALKSDYPGFPSWEIYNFFEDVFQKTNYITLFILDRFDKARDIFESEEDYFDHLRELAYNSTYGVKLVLTSRLNIEEIQNQAGSLSEFYGIFLTEPLGMFSERDLSIYFSKLSSIGVDTSAIYDSVLFYCGAHPYLLEMLGWHIVQEFQDNQEIDVHEIFANIDDSVRIYYNSLTRLLDEAKLLNPLLQILFESTDIVEGTDVNKLESYGLIKEIGDKDYAVYSEHFHNYLIKQYESSTEFAKELWPIWKKAEKALRDTITTTMSTEVGSDWIAQLGKSRPNLKKIFDECKSKQQDEIGSYDSGTLLDYSYPSDLFDIICSKALWREHFGSIFGEDIDHWKERKKFLAKCRTPLAHNREIEQHQRMIFEGYCKEIEGKLKK